MLLVFSDEIKSEDVTRHPQLLAAKQRKGFPNMVKHPVALRGGVCSQRWNFLLFLHAVFERLFWRYT